MAKKITKKQIALQNFDSWLMMNSINKTSSGYEFNNINNKVFNVDINIPNNTISQINRTMQILDDINDFVKLESDNLSKMSMLPNIKIGDNKSISVGFASGDTNNLHIPKSRLDDKIEKKNIGTMYNAIDVWSQAKSGMTALGAGISGLNKEYNYLRQFENTMDENILKRMVSIDNARTKYNQTGYDPSRLTETIQDDWWFNQWKQTYRG